MEIINNFIENKSIFENLKNTILKGNFEWYYDDFITSPGHDQGDFYLAHNFFSYNKQQSGHFNQILSPILGRLKYNYIIRAKANAYTRKEKHYFHGWHTDDNQEHQVALFFVNTNNGRTEFENGKIVESKENTLLLFNGNIKHRSVSQTDENLRVTININLIR